MKGRKLTIEPGIDEHGIRADVYVEDDANTVYDVEMQTTDKPLLRKTIVMFVCTFDPFHRDLPVYHFQHRSSEDCSLILDDAAEIVFELLEVGDLSLELAAKCLNLSVEEVEKEFESYKAQKK